MFAFASFCSLLLIDAYGFEGISIRGRGSPFGRKVRDADGRQSMTRIWGVRCEDKFYQLEEREDAECAKTELFLRTDRSIEFGKTDGPLAKEQAGTWEVEPGTNNFRMRVRRKFTTGAEGTDMGEFDFEVIREYTGEMKLVGESVGITGTMINKDDVLGDSEVGFFNMIDDTEERESYALEGRFRYEIDTTKGLRLSELPDAPRMSGWQPNQAPRIWEGTFGKKLGYFEERIDWSGQRQLGPGGYDPLDVVNALPPQMAEAFKLRDYALLNTALATLSREEAEYYLNGCMDAGLWIQPKTVEQRLGPAGYDPFEVLQVLPPQIAEAFRIRKYDMLESALIGLPQNEIEYHLKACIDSGLWVQHPPGGPRLGPGGLDPMDVLDTLPESMYLAFKNQNIEQLNAALSSLPKNEAEYHYKRCIDSGLWVE